MAPPAPYVAIPLQARATGTLGNRTGTSAPIELPGSTSTSSVAEPRAGSGGPSCRPRTRDSCLGWRRSRAAALGPQNPSVPQLPLILGLSSQGTAQSPCPGSSSPATDLAQNPGGRGAMGGGLALALPGPGRAVSRQGAGGGSRTLCPGQEVFRDAAEPSRLCTFPWKPYFVAASPARPAASSREAAAVDSSLLPSAASRAALPRPPRPQLSAPWAQSYTALAPALAGSSDVPSTGCGHSWAHGTAREVALVALAASCQLPGVCLPSTVQSPQMTLAE